MCCTNLKLIVLVYKSSVLVALNSKFFRVMYLEETKKPCGLIYRETAGHFFNGYEVVLLAGACIGVGSSVGARAITSSRFGDHVMIAGCPAKVIHENVCWSRDNTGFLSRSRLEECIEQKALKYMRDSGIWE